MANEPIQGLPYPELTGVPPNVPDAIKALADAVAPRTVMRFASTAARDAALPTPVDGMLCFVTADNTYYCRSGGGWRILARGLTAYTPTIQNLTLGSGGQADGSYVVAGGVVTVYTRIAFGGGGSVAANPVIGMPLDLPERPALPVGLAYLTDASAAGAAGRRAFMVVRNTATTVTMMNGHDGNTPNPSYPWTWASGDTIVMQTSYQIA